MLKSTLLFRLFAVLLVLPLSYSVHANKADKAAIHQAAMDYIQSQITPNPKQMARALHPEMRKRTYWLDKNNKEFVLETSVETMLKVAETYNKSGDRFSANPMIKVDILDIDQRAASVKLTVDEWIDYMHLMKTAEGEWKIINVLWQYHDTSRQKSKK